MYPINGRQVAVELSAVGEGNVDASVVSEQDAANPSAAFSGIRAGESVGIYRFTAAASLGSPAYVRLKGTQGMAWRLRLSPADAFAGSAAQPVRTAVRASAQIVSRRVRRGGRIIVKVYRATGIVTIKLRRGGRLVRIVRTTIRGGRVRLPARSAYVAATTRSA